MKNLHGVWIYNHGGGKMMIFMGLGLAIATYLYFFRESFFSELAISFLPYILVCCVLASLLLGVLLFFYKYRKIKNKSLKMFFGVCLLIWSLGIGRLYYSEFSSFYSQSADALRLENDGGLKIFYANILYTNADFQSLQKRIEIENPDIVILVEFSDAHEKILKDFFQKNYSYMNRNSWSATLAGDVIFSKVPLKNITQTHLVDTGEWNYSYVNIQSDGSKSGIDLYVIHTAAPVSIENFYMRNRQLEKFKFDFEKHQGANPTIIVGDFNLSPWSYYYSRFVDSLSLNMKNALSFQSPNYTRSLLGKKIFRSHIDQLFISDGIKISNIEISDLVGSDHRAFSFSFMLGG